MVFTASPKCRLGVQASFRLGRLLRHARRSYGVASRAKVSLRRQEDATRRVRRSRAGKRLKKTRRRLARAGGKHGAMRAREGKGRERVQRAGREGAARGNHAYTPARACPIAAARRRKERRGGREESRGRQDLESGSAPPPSS